ncbi:hypothetical protein BJ508DRAFT_327338 [Ascobolus immersus RN42]|uniref:Ecp2 effector protein domain-containing protein n=1 Tax=Ascobolus immersus RN42 TaxID=1160509 RepID=A0A3N4I2V7_ASCIM|nr:hypothetical protein BJ508DRAFT_327338 [Ascobolus immersus RN42]
MLSTRTFAQLLLLASVIQASTTHSSHHHRVAARDVLSFDPKNPEYPPSIQITLSKVTTTTHPKYKKMFISDSKDKKSVRKLTPGKLTCETTWASPFIPHAIELVRHYDSHRFDKHYICPQTNKKGSHCTTLAVHGSAAVGICSKDNVELECDEVYELVRGIVRDCKGEGFGFGQEGIKVGGMYEFELDGGGEGRVIIFHAPVN